jgi:ABC-type sugar transport system permease subunit
MASLQKTKALYGLAFILPSLVLLAALFVRPFIDLVVYSLYDKNLLRGKVSPDFVGFGNYVWAFTSPEFRHAMLRSLAVTASVTALSISLSMIIALLTNKEFRFKRIAFALMLLPWVTSSIASAFTFMWILDFSYGIVNYLAIDILNLSNTRVNWLGTMHSALPTVIMIMVWHFIPFSVLVLSAALKQIPESLYDSAQIDGASGWQNFWYVTLPSIKAPLLTLTIVRVAAVIRDFESVWLLTRGGPANSTETLPVFYYIVGFESFRAGKGAAIGVVIVAIVLLVYVGVIRTGGEEAV